METPRAVRAEIAKLLPGSGALPARYAAFDRRYLIAPDRLDAVLARAIDGCRAATVAHVSLPAGERVVVEYANDLAWSAFTRYEGRAASRIQVNAALPLTVDRALDLACHEAYPGHHTIDSLLDAASARRIELLVRPLFSPQSLLHEAAASLGSSVAFPGPERLAFERDELFPLAGLDPNGADLHVRVGRLVDRLSGVQASVARQYLDGALDFPRAAAALERDALMPSADQALKFLEPVPILCGHLHARPGSAAPPSRRHSPSRRRQKCSMARVRGRAVEPSANPSARAAPRKVR